MSAALVAWAISSIAVSALALIGGLISMFAMMGFRRTAGEARFILGCFALAFTSPSWPIWLLAGVAISTRGLWSDADLPTISQHLERRRTEIAVQRDRRVREQAATIARLEREAGIR